MRDLISLPHHSRLCSPTCDGRMCPTQRQVIAAPGRRSSGTRSARTGQAGAWFPWVYRGSESAGSAAMDLYGGNSGNLTVLRRALAAPALPDKPVTYEYAELRYSRLFVGGQMGAVARLGAGPPGGGGVVGCSRSRCWGRTGTGRATNDGQVDHRGGGSDVQGVGGTGGQARSGFPEEGESRNGAQAQGPEQAVRDRMGITGPAKPRYH
jgi:hypothetical protein